MVSLYSLPTRSDELVWRTIDDEVIILTCDGNEIHTLNKVGSMLWELSDGTKNLERIASLVCERFDVGREEAQTDVLEFAAQLSDKNILQIKEGISDD